MKDRKRKKQGSHRDGLAFLTITNYYQLLLKYFLCKHREVDAPVAPDVATVGLYILVLVTLAVPEGTKVDCALIEEVGAAHTHPVELGLAAEEAGALLCELRIGLDLLGK